MRKILAIVFIILFTTSCEARRDMSKKELLTDILVQTFGRSHYSGKKLNNEYSRDVFELYLKRLDVQKKFFYQSDYNELLKYRTLIDNQLLDKEYDFYDEALRILIMRVDEVQSNYLKILDQPFDFTIDETLSFDYDSMRFAQNGSEMKEKWRKILKYEALRRYLELTAGKDQTKFYPEIEKEARVKVKKQINRVLDRLENQNETDNFEIYLNAVANVFDPHTSYFAPKQDQDFTIGMTGKLEGIGALLSENDGYIKVVRIIPGSASWRQKELEAEDIILKVAQGNEDPVDVVEMPLDDAVLLIRGKKGTQVRLTVKKTDGRILVIPITRDSVVIEETYAKSTVLENPVSGTRVGYIDLPVFYHDFKDDSARSSSQDVKSEIEKLKKQNIKAMILDLRNNGGGALTDAIDMSGLFIPEGPIVQVKDSDGRIEVLSDEDPSVSWNGPLIIMVNKLSASASEIVSAALQDYGRAIVVGSDSTFGKGTVQSYINIDRFLPMQHMDYKPLGAIKITLQKFYRVNGDSTQYKGVVPDIILPDLYQHLEIGEKHTDYSIGWDRIKAQKYSPWTKKSWDMETLVQQSTLRVATNKALQLVNENAKYMKEQQEKNEEPLLLTKMIEKDKILKEKNEVMQKILDINDMEMQVLGLNSGKDEKDWLEKVRKDKYIQEAMNIVGDVLR